MLILLDCRPLWVSPLNAEKSQFIIDCAALLSGHHAVEWFLLTDKRHPPEKQDLPAGLTARAVKALRTLPGSLGRRIWYDWQLPAAARRYKPDLLMTTAGITASRSRTPCPQCVWMSAASGLFSVAAYPVPASSGIAATPPADKLFHIPPFPGEQYKPLSQAEKEKLKADHAEGTEYFLVLISGAAPDELIGLLKAFSLFKKRQRSNMQLILTGRDANKTLSATGRLDSYMYRSSVHTIDDPSPGLLARLVAAAYAYISPFGRDAIGIDLLNAWAAGTPVIAALKGPSQVLGPDAMLTMDPNAPASLAAQLMRVYTNEEERAALIERGTINLRSFDRDQAAGGLWEGILRAKG